MLSLPTHERPYGWFLPEEVEAGRGGGGGCGRGQAAGHGPTDKYGRSVRRGRRGGVGLTDRAGVAGRQGMPAGRRCRGVSTSQSRDGQRWRPVPPLASACCALAGAVDNTRNFPVALFVPTPLRSLRSTGVAAAGGGSAAGRQVALKTPRELPVSIRYTVATNPPFSPDKSTVFKCPAFWYGHC